MLGKLAQAQQVPGKPAQFTPNDWQTYTMGVSCAGLPGTCGVCVQVYQSPVVPCFYQACQAPVVLCSQALPAPVVLLLRFTRHPL